ncbi:unannotated protein [freshwater metagenome]|uniref:Unannotated protein n=1 Tax=freshwater metagenome TaxID=449393 RepID=A0A6J7DKC9_9ZZZZ
MTDTQDEMVPAQPTDGVAPRKVHRAWALPLVGLGFLVLAAVVLAAAFTASRISAIKRPYAIVPADAQSVEPRLTLSGVTRYHADGELLFVTIREPQLSLLSWFMFRHDNDIHPLTYNDINGNGTPQQQTSRGRRQMVTAKQAAEYVALKKLGFPIDMKPGNIVIDQMVCLKANAAGTACVEEAPSGKVLKPDDELVSIDGTPVKVLDDLRSVLARHKAGDMVDVEYKRPGVDGVQKGSIELTASPDADKKVIVGFYPFDTTEVGDSPFPVSIDTAGIGGPSAGLAFTLTLIDELTPGELTGGQRVAVTGTIDVDGKVGAIGGLAQKASAVRQTGTKYFLVPAAQSDAEIAEARAVAGGAVQIIPVATIDEALAALAKLGGNSAALGTPGKDFTPAK